LYLENMLRENETRLRESEQHASNKEKELLEAINRLRDYESGDYQLQQAVNEIKALKNQIKIRDRDIETLTKHLNKLDFSLNDVLEENDDFRAKLGMQPREKLNLDELNNLRAIRAQENRAYVYVLQREVSRFPSA
jgi:centrosomal protein CEP290